jgi:hypothetical protein
MIIVIDNETNVGDLHKALRRGGFVLRAKPKGIFELIRVNNGRPTCDLCERPSAVRNDLATLCAKHWLDA